MIKIKIKPSRELFFDEEQSFGIYACDVNPDNLYEVATNKYNNISIKGVTPRLNKGQEYEVTLREDTGSAYAGSYIIENIKKERPSTVAEQKAFLQTILTEKQVENIYSVYSEQDDVVGLIEKGEFDYQKVHGLGDKTFDKLREKVLENLDISEVLAFLSKYSIKYNTISKLVKEYGNPQIVIDKIEANPYLLTEVKGIGFKRADTIAKAMKYSMTSPHRIESAIHYIIGEENQSGHSWIDYKTLLNRAIELLSIDKTYIIDVLNSQPKNIMKVDERYTKKSVYDAEDYVSMKMTQYKTQSTKFIETEELDKFLDEYCANHNVELEENQRQFFHDWNENSILMLIGGGGMGRQTA